MATDKDNMYFLPMHKCVEYANVELPIHPYLLGVLLGDGTIAKNHIRFASNDDEIVNKVTNIVSEYGLSVNRVSDKNILYTITGGRSNSQKGARILARENINTGAIEVLGTLKEANFKLGFPTSRTALLGRCNKNSIING